MLSVLSSIDILPLIITFQSGFHQQDLVLVKELRTYALKKSQVVLYQSATVGSRITSWIHRASLSEFIRLHVCDEDLLLPLADAIACSGRLDLLNYLQKHSASSVTYSVSALDGAASAGHLSIVGYLTTDGAVECTTDALDQAAAKGHLEIVRYLTTNRTEGCTHRALDLAALGGHLDVVQHLCEHGLGCFATALDIAAASGHFEVARFLHPRTPGCSTAAVDGAIEGGFWDVVMFLLNNRTEGGSIGALEIVSAEHRIDVLRLLLSVGQTSHADTTKALHEACRRGYLEVVKLLASKSQQPWKSAIHLTVQYGHLEVLKFLLEMSESQDVDGTEALITAASYNRVEIIQYLVKIGEEKWLEQAWQVLRRSRNQAAINRIAAVRPTSCSLQ